MTYLLGTYNEMGATFAGSYLIQLVQALRDVDWTRFFKILDTLLANIPYDIQIPQEKYYQTIFYLIFKLIGLEIQAEVRTNQGRIDAVLETEEAVYIFGSTGS